MRKRSSRSELINSKAYSKAPVHKCWRNLKTQLLIICTVKPTIHTNPSRKCVSFHAPLDCFVYEPIRCDYITRACVENNQLARIITTSTSKYDICCTNPLIDVTSLKFGLHVYEVPHAQVIACTCAES